MGVPAPTLRAPADWRQKSLTTLISPLFKRVFSIPRPCQHPHPTYPIANRQTCPDCGAVRDYIRSSQWRDELDRILAAYIYATDYPSREKWLADLGQLFQVASDVFIGEWRKGGR